MAKTEESKQPHLKLQEPFFDSLGQRCWSVAVFAVCGLAFGVGDCTADPAELSSSSEPPDISSKSCIRSWKVRAVVAVCGLAFGVRGCTADPNELSSSSERPDISTKSCIRCCKLRAVFAVCELAFGVGECTVD